MKNLILLLTLLACVLGVRAAPKAPDPVFAQITDDPQLPRVLLIGDSVSCGYTLAVRKELAGQANVHRPAANCGSTKIGLRDLDVTVNDLWAFATPQLDKLQQPGNPHFTSKGSEVLAHEIAQIILTALNRKTSRKSKVRKETP